MNPILPQVTGGGGVVVGIGTGNGSFTSRPTVKPLKQYTHTHREREREKKKGKIYNLNKKKKNQRKKDDATMLPLMIESDRMSTHTQLPTDPSAFSLSALPRPQLGDQRPENIQKGDGVIQSSVSSR